MNSNFYTYDFINAYNSTRNPSQVHCHNTELVNMYTRYFLQKLISVFEFKGVPEYVPMNYLQYVLLGWGKIAFINTDKFGVIPQFCTLGGYNVFYQPSYVIITNPSLTPNSQMLKIGEMCEVVKMQPDYGGALDLVSTYADLMGLALESAGINLVNSKLAYVFAAGNKAQAETFKKLYDEINSGRPAVFADKNIFNPDGSPNWQFITQDLKKNYITDAILEDMKRIEDKFETEIGIPNANTYKKERMINSEVGSNNIATSAKAVLWAETMQEGFEKVNNMFGTNYSVAYRYASEINPERSIGNEPPILS